jgi:hypothetical protein
MPLATGNAVISCIHVAHTKYELNPLDWQRVVEIGYCLFMRQDMETFQEMCKDGLLGQGDYGIFKDRLAIDRLRNGYIHIRNALVLEGEIQEMNNEENFFTMRGCTRPVFVDFSWRTTRWSLIIGGSHSIRRNWSIISSSR